MFSAAVLTTMTFSPPEGSPERPASPDFAFFPHLGPEEAKIADLYRGYENTQWWPADSLHKAQFDALFRLVTHARQNVPFYAETPGRLPPIIATGIDETVWRALPILTKEEVRAETARLRSQRLPAGATVFSEWTTGSSGQPLEVFKTSTFNLRFRALKLRLLRGCGYDPMGKVCEIRRPFWTTGETVHRLSHWEWPFGTLFPTGEQVIMDVFSEIEAQVRFLETEAPHYLMTYPSNLRLLLRAFQRTGRRLPTLRHVRTITERLDPDLRRECQETLGVPLADTYGCQEAGFIAIQCPAHAHYHVQSETTLVEVLRDDGTPCQPGETGRVIVTPLYAYAMPLLRYDLGDYAEVGESCPCGRGLPVLRQIHGRQKEALILPTGERRYSVFAGPIFHSLPAVLQFQIIQKTRTLLEVHLVTERPLEKPETDLIVDRLTTQVGPGFEIRLLPVPQIPRPPSGKCTDFLSEVEAGDASSTS